MQNFSVLKIYASSTDHIGSTMLYEYIVREARDFGITGATVNRGIMGFGSSSKISSSKFWELTEKLPVTIEMLDDTERLEAFFRHIEPILAGMPKGCVVTLEPVMVKLIKPGPKK
jgi:PII-like signaling protein